MGVSCFAHVNILNLIAVPTINFDESLGVIGFINILKIKFKLVQNIENFRAYVFLFIIQLLKEISKVQLNLVFYFGKYYGK